MAWFGKITDLKQREDGWLVTVDFYDDAFPNRIITRTLSLPLTVTRTQAVQAIQRMGQEIRARVNLNTENVIGTVVPIP